MEIFKKTDWKILEKYEIADTTISNIEFSYHHFIDLWSKEVKYEKCVFRHCVFERAFFRNSLFKNCEFRGCHFVSCNFRGVNFENVVMKYVFFDKTIIPKDQVVKCLPEWPMVRAETLRILRANAESIGDKNSADFFIKYEILALKDHYGRASRLEDHYYKERYSGILNQTKVRIKRIGLWLNGILWGHLEYPFRIFITPLIISLLIAFILNSTGVYNVFWTSYKSVFVYLIGLTEYDDKLIPSAYKTILVLVRYYLLGVLFSIIIRRVSPR